MCYAAFVGANSLFGAGFMQPIVPAGYVFIVWTCMLF